MRDQGLTRATRPTMQPKIRRRPHRPLRPRRCKSEPPSCSPPTSPGSCSAALRSTAAFGTRPPHIQQRKDGSQAPEHGHQCKICLRRAPALGDVGSLHRIIAGPSTTPFARARPAARPALAHSPGSPPRAHHPPDGGLMQRGSGRTGPCGAAPVSQAPVWSPCRRPAIVGAVRLRRRPLAATVCASAPRSRQQRWC